MINDPNGIRAERQRYSTKLRRAEVGGQSDWFVHHCAASIGGPTPAGWTTIRSTKDGGASRSSQAGEAMATPPVAPRAFGIAVTKLQRWPSRRVGSNPRLA